VRRHFLGTVELLLANKQIHNEGYEYMLKKNLFVRIQCQGFEVQRFLHGHVPGIANLSFGKWPIIAASTNKYPWFAMRVQVTTDRRLKLESPLSTERNHRVIVMLWKDCGEFFRRFEAETAMEYTQRVGEDSLRIIVEFGPDQDSGRGLRGLSAEFFTSSMQQRLLEPIAGLRGHPSLEIKGCLAESVATATIQTASQPLWPSSEALHAQLTCQLSCAQEALRTGDLKQCAHICAANTHILYRLRRSPWSLHLIKQCTQGFAGTLAQLNWTFHVLFGQCLHAHLSTPPDQRTYIPESTHIASTSSAMVAILEPSKPPAESFMPGWSVSRHELAEIRYLKAKGKRLLFEHSLIASPESPEEALALIHSSLENWPENETFKEEGRVIEGWMQECARYRVWSRANPGSPYPTVTMADWRQKLANGGLEDG
jgi:hypothetical protein